MRCNDILYINSKNKKLNNNYLNDIFYDLYDFIFEKHSIFPLHIELNNMSKSEKRLDVILEYKYQVELMYDDQKLNFNKIYQQEIESFLKINILSKNQSIISNTEKIFISFRSFEAAAIEEANMSISSVEIENLLIQFNQYNLWKIYRVFDSVTFFYIKEKDIFNNLENGITKKITNEYKKLLKRYDEFNYLNSKNFEFNFASKENLDKNYDSNLYYFHL